MRLDVYIKLKSFLSVGTGPAISVDILRLVRVVNRNTYLNM